MKDNFDVAKNFRVKRPLSDAMENLASSYGMTFSELIRKVMQEVVDNPTDDFVVRIIGSE